MCAHRSCRPLGLTSAAVFAIPADYAAVGKNKIEIPVMIALLEGVQTGGSGRIPCLRTARLSL